MFDCENIRMATKADAEAVAAIAAETAAAAVTASVAAADATKESPPLFLLDL